MRVASMCSALLAITTVSLAACTTPPAVVAAPEPLPLPLPLPPTPPARPVAPAPVTATWSFRSGGACSATAANPVLSLEVGASNEALSLELHMSRRVALPANASVPITFSGAAGTWTTAGRLNAPRRVSASGPMTEDAASRVLVLLAGGTIRTGGRQRDVPVLRIPDAGVAGRNWFECVRQRLLP